jgi:hypothetical protein
MPIDIDDLIMDPSLNPNQFRPDTQPDFHMAKELLTDDFAESMRKRVKGYGWDESTMNSINDFLDYLKSQAVVLSNYDSPMDVKKAVLNVKIAFMKQSLLGNRADTGSSEYMSFKDYCFQYLEDKMTRAQGKDRERILQHPYRTLIDQKVQHQISQEQTQQHGGWTDRFKRKGKQYEE